MILNKMLLPKYSTVSHNMDMVNKNKTFEGQHQAFSGRVGCGNVYCIVGWVNFSEFEITLCGSCKMSTTRKIN